MSKTACIYVYAFPDGYIIHVLSIYRFICIYIRIYICIYVYMWLKLNPTSQDIQNKEPKAWKNYACMACPENKKTFSKLQEKGPG